MYYIVFVHSNLSKTDDNKLWIRRLKNNTNFWIHKQETKIRNTYGDYY